MRKGEGGCRGSKGGGGGGTRGKAKGGRELGMRSKVQEREWHKT